MTNAEAWFNIALRPRKPEGSLGRTAQDGHLDSHTAPELYDARSMDLCIYIGPRLGVCLGRSRVKEPLHRSPPTRNDAD